MTAIFVGVRLMATFIRPLADSPQVLGTGAHMQVPPDTRVLFPGSHGPLRESYAHGTVGLQFSSCTLSLNVAAAPHKDKYNHHDSVNLALPLSRFQGGELFVEHSEGRTQLSQAGPAGHILDMQFPVVFPPTSLHATLPWTNTRLILVAFHIGQAHKLQEHDLVQLRSMGFRVGFTALS